MTYYNEFDPHAAAWLRNLIADGVIPNGEVDERDIWDIVPTELVGYDQCHFFAGIGGWAYALRLIGWPDDEPVWTGSCPCQPFSAAGSGLGFDDERHLWPAWFWLIQQCRPRCIFGEQVSGSRAWPWFSLVSNDLEGIGYQFDSLFIPACSIGAPHRRERGYWAATNVPLAYPQCLHPQRPRQQMGIASREKTSRETERERVRVEFESGMSTRGMENPNSIHVGVPVSTRGQDPDCADIDLAGATNGFWRECDWVLTRPERVDGTPSLRPSAPGAFPLVDGLPGRVHLLRGAGNAIVPQQAGAFVMAVCSEIEGGQE